MITARLAPALALAGSALFASLAAAAVYSPTRFDDPAPDGCLPTDCSLREAVIAANANPGPDRIEFIFAGTYELSIAGRGEDAAATGDLDLTESVEVGPPPGLAVDATTITIDANGIDRVFDVRSPDGSLVALRSLQITGGWATGVDDTEGGGVQSPTFSGSRTLEIADCWIEGNQAGLGGGVHVRATLLTLRNSLIRGNTAGGDGSGLRCATGGAASSCSVVNSTITENDSTGEGQGVFAVGPVLVEQSTVIGNRAHTATTPIAADLETAFEPASAFRGSILGVCGFGFFATTSLGGNVESPGNTCNLSDPTDLKNVSPAALDLQPLADNGGPTRTRRLGPASVAADRTFGARCQFHDQRGFPRRSNTDGRCAAGAFEPQPFCRQPNLVIPDGNPAGVTDTLVTASLTSLPSLDLYLNISHTWVGDLTAQLSYSGSGAVSSVLIDRPGFPVLGSGCHGDDINLVLDDEAATGVETDCLSVGDPNSGLPAFPTYATYRPGDPPAALLDSFAHRPIAGSWSLKVADLVALDSGALNEWCLIPRGHFLGDGFESGNTLAWTTAP